jgi:hypothetical protein
MHVCVCVVIDACVCDSYTWRGMSSGLSHQGALHPGGLTMNARDHDVILLKLKAKTNDKLIQSSHRLDLSRFTLKNEKKERKKRKKRKEETIANDNEKNCRLKQAKIVD